MTTSVSAPPAEPGLGAPATRTAIAPRGSARRRLLLRLVSLVVLGLLWALTTRAAHNPAFIPSPAAVWHQLIVTSTTHDGVRGYSGHLLIEHLGVSLRRILIGSAIGVVAGRLLGSLDPVEHPVVRVHPETGRKDLFVNPGFTSHLVGVSTAESRGILDLLYAHLTKPEHVVRHRWRPGDVAMWDIRSTAHYANRDYGDERRVMHRITLRGDLPAGPPAAPEETR